jgi:uncharacterized cupin superfamily protein
MGSQHTSSTRPRPQESTSADGTAPRPVRTVVADHTLLDGTPFTDKPTTITAGQRERAATAWTADGAGGRAGYWECESGTFTAVRDGVHEVCYIISGHASLRDASGAVTEIRAGSLLVLPAGWDGTWEVHEPVEKMFVIFPE